jgi:hypothetical protein
MGPGHARLPVQSEHILDPVSSSRNESSVDDNLDSPMRDM